MVVIVNLEDLDVEGFIFLAVLVQVSDVSVYGYCEYSTYVS